MESLKEYYNCLCCKEIASINPQVTSCCSNIICGDCYNKLDKCPLKCQGERQLTTDKKNWFKLIQMVMNLGEQNYNCVSCGNLAVNSKLTSCCQEFVCDFCCGILKNTKECVNANCNNHMSFETVIPFFRRIIENILQECKVCGKLIKSSDLENH